MFSRTWELAVLSFQTIAREEDGGLPFKEDNQRSEKHLDLFAISSTDQQKTGVSILARQLILSTLHWVLWLVYMYIFLGF